MLFGANNSRTCCEVEDGAVVETAIDVCTGHDESVGGVGHQAPYLDAAMFRNLVKNPDVILMVILKVILNWPIAR